MRGLVIILIIFLAAFFYIKKAVKSFKINLVDINNLQIKDKHLRGFVTLQIDNKKLPSFDIKQVNLDVHLNNKYLAEIKQYQLSKKGQVKLFLNIPLTLEMVLNLVKNSRLISLYGSIKIEKSTLSIPIPVNESFYI